MPPENPLNKDIIRIRHMVDAIREALSFVAGKKREDLDCDRQLTLSLMKEIEMVGEAAGRVSAEARQRHPIIPWDLIVGARNRLIHGYFDVDLDIVWSTVTIDLPPLLAALEEILSGKA